ncbi:MAG: hypothetical protein LUG18_03155 [Candidatus Azobacteroides sp.]|nr:hypothetical protein [Candidatus Azobacteroides sp.]
MTCRFPGIDWPFLQQRPAVSPEMTCRFARNDRSFHAQRPVISLATTGHFSLNGQSFFCRKGWKRIGREMKTDDTYVVSIIRLACVLFFSKEDLCKKAPGKPLANGSFPSSFFRY